MSEIDFRLAFLQRAASRLLLVEACLMDIDEAFDGLVSSLQCSCSLGMVERWERTYPPPRRQRRRAA
jgi:hypothetical protein